MACAKRPGLRQPSGAFRNDTFYTCSKSVFRSFYLALRKLPARVRPQTGLACLLARTGAFPACFLPESV
jgi:hypothetical protein